MKKLELRQMIREELLKEGTKIKGDVRGNIKMLEGLGIKLIEVDKNGEYIEITFNDGKRLSFDISADRDGYLTVVGTIH